MDHSYWEFGYALRDGVEPHFPYQGTLELCGKFQAKASVIRVPRPKRVSRQEPAQDQLRVGLLHYLILGTESPRHKIEIFFLAQLRSDLPVRLNSSRGP
jgi:hypothetical protein